jgi:putative ABC transport system substrate-binding protein
MRRREFIGCLGSAALARPLAAMAQGRSLPLAGYLHGGAAIERAQHTEAFRRGLREGGYVIGKDVAIEYRWAEGRYERLTVMAAEYVKRKVAVIAAASTPAAMAAKDATKSIPVVFIGSGDPVKLGLVASLSRPGGNVTGIANIGSALEAKRIEALRDLIPHAKRIGYLANPKFPGAAALVKDVQSAGEATGTAIHVVNASTVAEIDAAFAALAQSRLNALVVMPDSYFITRREQIVALAAQYAIPTCYSFREYPVAGGLMSYGPDLIESNRQHGLYTARVLKGAKPADLPVMQATKFDLVINRQATKKLGLAISRDFLERVDEVVE